MGIEVAEIKPGYRTTIELKTDTITKACIERCKRALEGFNAPFNEEAVGWYWQKDNGPVFTKRYQKWYGENYPVRVNANLLDELSNTLRRNMLMSGVYNIVVTDNFNWKAGTFGDDRSCFWGGRAVAKDIIKDNGGFAIQVFDGHNKPLGRSWGFIHEKNNLVIFNGYGFNGADALVNIAGILSILLEANYKEVILSNMKMQWSESLLYINNGRAFVYGPYKNNKLNIEWNEYNYVPCRTCGRNQRNVQTIQDHNENHYCQECAETRLFVCTHFKQFFLREDGIEFYNDKPYSPKAFKLLFDRCILSNQIFPREELIQTQIGPVHISKKDQLNSCERCKRVYPLGHIIDDKCSYCAILTDVRSGNMNTLDMQDFSKFLRFISEKQDQLPVSKLKHGTYSTPSFTYEVFRK